MNELRKLADDLLKSQGISPKKGYGQNFLIDRRFLKMIRMSLPLTEVAEIVEIGPGLGFLTEELILTGLPVTVIEADDDMTAILLKRFDKKIQILADDVKKVDLSMFHVKQTLFVGNLPYNITKEIIEALMLLPAPIRFSVMVQKEVALKLTSDGQQNFTNAMAAYLGLKGSFEKTIEVPRSAFSPSPHVDSAFLNYRGFNQIPAATYSFLKMLFRQPKKTISNNLKAAGYYELPLAIDIRQMRPHQLTIEQLKKLVSLFVSSVI